MMEIGEESRIRKKLIEIDEAYKQAPWQTMQKEMWKRSFQLGFLQKAGIIPTVISSFI